MKPQCVLAADRRPPQRGLQSGRGADDGRARAQEVAHRAYVLDLGRNKYDGAGHELLPDAAVAELPRLFVDTPLGGKDVGPSTGGRLPDGHE